MLASVHQFLCVLTFAPLVCRVMLPQLEFKYRVCSISTHAAHPHPITAGRPKISRPGVGSGPMALCSRRYKLDEINGPGKLKMVNRLEWVDNSVLRVLRTSLLNDYVFSIRLLTMGFFLFFLLLFLSRAFTLDSRIVKRHFDYTNRFISKTV